MTAELIWIAGREVIPSVFKYGTMVESWAHVIGPYSSGSKRRKYNTEFTGTEQMTVARWHAQFRKWYLVTGPPEYVHFHDPTTVMLLLRAIKFFAEV